MIIQIGVGCLPLYPIYRESMLPYWIEWLLFLWLCGEILVQFTEKQEKKDFVKVFVQTSSNLNINIFFKFKKPVSYILSKYFILQFFRLEKLFWLVQLSWYTLSPPSFSIKGIGLKTFMWEINLLELLFYFAVLRYKITSLIKNIRGIISTFKKEMIFVKRNQNISFLSSLILWDWAACLVH